MDPLVFFIALTVIYFVALFFDSFFKSCMHYPYDAFLRNTGLTVQFLRLKWYTTAFNRTLFKWSSSCNRLLTQSFNIGVIFSLGLIPIGIIILFGTLFHSSSSDSAQNHAGSGKTGKSPTTTHGLMDMKMELVLPGINMPLDEIGFYICTLVVCTVVHELGHALAAILEDVPVIGFGFNIYYCLPVAYTELNTDHMNTLRPFRKMRILCAGIWHNIILAALCYLLYTGVGSTVDPFYSIDGSVVITEITKNSPLLGEKGLFVGDVITDINGCRIKNIDSWKDCLSRTIRKKPGYCVSSDFIRLHDESGRISHGANGIIQCCDSANVKMCCFEYIIDRVSDEGPIEIPQHICLDIRKTIEDSGGFCTSGECDMGYCIRPLLNNVTTIMTIKRKRNLNHGNEKLSDVIYIGHPVDLLRTVKLSIFIPKMSFLTSNFADNVVLFLKYNVVFSAGFAVINSIPCFGLDGYHISSTIINNFLISKIPERERRELIVLLITSLGTILSFGSLIKIAVNSIYKSFQL